MEFNLPKIEEKILRFWRKNQIFEKSIERRKRAKNFVFYEGPPTANAKAGIHHVLSRVFKDIICRYKTMRGWRVLRKAGWDTHGLPVELEIEKKLGLRNKKDIEKYGLAKFNRKCRDSVWEYKKDWERLTDRIGFWLDMKNPYITYQAEYIETVWRILKTIWEKGLLYQDFKVVPYCPRCGTSLSSHEVAQGYKKVREKAIYIKFKILNPEFKNTSFLVWTTTPWTLPGNVAVAVNPNFNYSKVKVGGSEEFLILAKDRAEPLGIKGEISREFKGRDLLDLRYEPFYPSDEEVLKSAYRVIPAEFVSLKEGTGLVHIAPAFGEEDMDLMKMTNSKIQMPNERLPILLSVDEEGKFKFEVKKWAGLFVKEADPLIIEDLKNRGLLFKEELCEHDYPFCWRCRTPLLYYAKKSWFIKMTEVKKILLNNNQAINWIPAHLKNGRFGEWLREVKDWALTRERYWGTPLPIWQCPMCKKIEVIGSLNDLLSQKFSDNNYFILRHGHSLRQVKNLASCWPEKFQYPLTKEGEDKVLKEAKKLKKENIVLIFSSDILRTKQTAEIISRETGARIIFDKRLREFNVGIFNGKDPKLVWDYMSKQKNIFSAKIPQGESLAAVRKRTYNFLEEIDGKYKEKNILIVSHEFPLTILEGTLRGRSLGEILEWRRKNRAQTIGTGNWRRLIFKKLPFNEKMELDFHRPLIDEVKFLCRNCQSRMERLPEVIDCWFDSGSMPFAIAQSQNSKLKSQKLKPPELFPADYICEGIDQTRGWFYTLLAISTLLGFGPAYKNVISLGHILDEKGEKMSKSRGNVVDPWYIIEKYGTDAARWYFYIINQPGDSKLFSEKDMQETLRRFIFTLWNCYIFFETYGEKTKNQKPKTKNLLDRWIISKLNGLIQKATENLDKYDITSAARAIENFAINDLSLWHIRRSRRRFQRPETEEELKEASRLLGFVLLTLSKLTAPFIPFLSEEIYQNLKPKTLNLKPQSIHLTDWPKANKKLIDKKLDEKMEKVREIVNLALAERAKTEIKARQPIASLKIKNQKSKIKNDKKLLELIKDEVNVKKIIFDEGLKKEVELDTKITPELKEEGIIREIIRHLQEMRKKAGFKPKDKILVYCLGTENLNRLLNKNKEFVMKEGKIKDFKIEKKEKRIFDIEKEIKVDKETLWLAIKRI